MACSPADCQNLIDYSVFNGACKLIRRFRSKDFCHKHYEVFKGLAVADLRYPPRDQLDRLRKLLGPGILTWLKLLPPGILTAARQPKLFDALKRSLPKPLEEPATEPTEKPDEEFQQRLSAVLEGILPKPDDGPDAYLGILAEFHLSIADCLENLEVAMPALRNLLTKFRQNRQAPTDEVLQAALDKVYNTLWPLTVLAWKSELFEWYITVFLAPQHLGAGVFESALEDAEDQDEDGSEDESGFDNPKEPHRPQSASEHPEAHRKPPKNQVDATKEWVYWLRLMTAPVHYSVMLRGDRQGRGKLVQFLFQVIDCPPVSSQMKPWRQVVKDLFPRPSEYHTIIDELARRFGSGSKPNLISDPSYTFKGCVHCEAMLASLRHVASLHHAPRQDEVRTVVYSVFSSQYTDRQAFRSLYQQRSCRH